MLKKLKYLVALSAVTLPLLGLAGTQMNLTLDNGTIIDTWYSTNPTEVMYFDGSSSTCDDPNGSGCIPFMHLYALGTKVF